MFDQDPQRVCILQGPVATKHATKKDEPIKELLGNIESALIAKILEQYYDNDETKIPTVDFLSGISGADSVEALEGVQIISGATSTTYKVVDPLPNVLQWLSLLSGPSSNWLRALLVSPTIVQGNDYLDNPMRRVFAPRTGQSVIVKHDGLGPSSVVVFGAARSYGSHKPDFKSLELNYDAITKRIDLTMYEDRNDVAVPLSLEFEYRPDQGFAPIHEIVESRNRRIKTFYWKLWFGDDSELDKVDVRDTYISPEVVIDVETVEKFCSVVENHNESFSSTRQALVQAPMDFAIVVGWKVRHRLFANHRNCS